MSVECECPYCDHVQTFDVTETAPYTEPVECLYCRGLFVVSANVELNAELEALAIEGQREKSEAYRAELPALRRKS
jgi:hypothetical protein